MKYRQKFPFHAIQATDLQTVKDFLDSFNIDAEVYPVLNGNFRVVCAGDYMETIFVGPSDFLCYDDQELYLWKHDNPAEFNSRFEPV